MTRLTPLTYDEASPEQRAIWDGITGTRGDPASLVDTAGSLVGPFNAMVLSPTVGGRIAALGGAIRFESHLERRLLELAIITVGAHWRSNFEWWAHSQMARDAGVADSVIDDIGEGIAPTFAHDDESKIYAFAHELVNTGRVTSDSYGAVRDLVGETATVDLVSTIGYYCLISLTLNAHAISVPAGVIPAWPS